MKKGFTLIELLAVIVILAIIALIAVPIILNVINDTKKNSDKISIEMYGRSIKNAIADYGVVNDGQVPKTIEDLDIENYYRGNKVKCEIERIDSYGEVYLSECKVDNKDVEYTYGEYIDSTLAERPNLVNGLTPVIYNKDHWEIADTSKEWYDYSKQNWANAVILSENGKTKKVGEELKVPTSTSDVEQSDVKAMFVWIPRYSYTISSDAKGEQETCTSSSKSWNCYKNPGAIDIKFVSKNTKESGSATYDGDTASNYYTHPAFTFGSEELSGFWVGKFETTGDKNNPTILPNVPSLRNQSVSNQFETAKLFNKNVSGDSHMMKNSEWGAVAYLSQSKYGKYGNSDYAGANKEVYQNKSSSYITGNSNGTPSQDTSQTQCSYDDITNRGEGKGSCGGGASTTGNIYGIYDMSGGAWERVMGVYTNASSSSIGFSSLPDEKYYDEYTSTSSTTACDGKACKGHALNETLGWYGDYANFVSATYPWFFRGGYSTEGAGVFVFDVNVGGSYYSYSFRVVFAPTT